MKEETSPKRKGICYPCMNRDHQHCYRTSGRTDCMCKETLHDLPQAKFALGKDPHKDPPMMPEPPAQSDKFYFI